jgi:uncharacterized membrane protein
MWRAIAWCAIALLAVFGKLLDNDLLRGAGLLVLLGVLAWSAPKFLKIALCVVIVCAAILVANGYTAKLFDIVPALVAALIGWLFARTLFNHRVPLIARAIDAIDGPEPLRDPAVMRYAKGLTAIWAVFQFALGAIGVVLALHAWGLIVAWPLPSPARFGLIGLPIAVAVLFLTEFALRRRLLPQAPRLPLVEFLRRLVRAWPALLKD